MHRRRVATTIAMLVGTAAVSTAAGALVSARISTEAERRFDERVDAAVERSMWEYAQAANAGARMQTTSTEGTFWWLGYMSADTRRHVSRLDSAWEMSFHADAEAAGRFGAVHQVIDDKPSWSDAVSGLPEPYLAYPGGP